MNSKNEVYYYSNFKRNNKWLGIIDYRLIIFLLIYLLMFIKIIALFNFSIEIKLIVFCSGFVPFLSFVIISYKEENAIEIIVFILKYFINRKIFINYNIKKFKGQIYK